MKPGTQKPNSTVTGSSAADTTTVSTLTAPGNAAGMLLTVETTNARMTFDGTDPHGGTGSHVIPKDQLPLFLPIGNGTVVKWVSTASAVSTVNITWTS